MNARAGGAGERLDEIVDDRLHSRLAGAALEDFRGDGIGLEHSLRRQQKPATLRLVVGEPHAARQPRDGAVGDRRCGIGHQKSSGTKAPGGTCLGAT